MSKIRAFSSSCLLCAFCLFSPSLLAGQTFRYKVLSNSQTSGSEVDTSARDGHVDSAFEFNDRGRGPKVAAHYVLSADASPSRVDITGNDYLKAPVDEHFSIESGSGHWKSTTEDGKAPAPGFYISNNGPMLEVAFLVNALFQAQGAPVKLFPAGEARLEKMTDVTVESHGQKIHVTEFAITGLSFEPQTIWLDDNHRFFGFPGKWFAIMREGFEDTNGQLYALQRKAQDERYARLGRELAQHPNHPVAVQHVRIFDSEQAATREDQTVIVQGERIAAVGPASTTTIPKDAELIDGRGKTLLPGLFDMHAHLQALDGILNIASGVTTARDMGNDIDELRDLQGGWDSGASIGPHVWKAGFIDGRGPFQAPTGLYADTAVEAQAAVNRYADLGYIQIKLYSSLNPDFVPGIAKTAHARSIAPQRPRPQRHCRQPVRRRRRRRDPAHQFHHAEFSRRQSKRYPHTGALHRRRRQRSQARPAIEAGQ